MALNDQKSVLIVEDDRDWQHLFAFECKKRQWKYTVIDNPGSAIRLIESGDKMFDAAIVDKGDNDVIRRGGDNIGHGDGLTVLRSIKDHQPNCIRILATGENWSSTLFTDPTLRLHMFMDKGYHAEFGEAMYGQIRQWDPRDVPERTIVFMPRRGGERLF